MAKHKHVWDESGTCACGEYWGNYRKTLKPTPAAPREEELPLDERCYQSGFRDGREHEAKAISGVIGYTTLATEEVKRWMEKCKGLEAKLAAQAQAVEALEAERDRLREDLRAAKEYADQAADNLLESAMKNEKFREALAWYTGASAEVALDKYERMGKCAALELNSKPPLPGEGEKP